MNAPFTPPAPKPRAKPVGPVGFVWNMWKNPLEVWGQLAFDKLVITGPTIRGHNVMFNDGEGIKQTLIERAGNYRRDRIVQAILKPALGDGLFTAEGDTWRRARRTLAPVFAPRHLVSLTDIMRSTAETVVSELAAKEQVDVSDAMTRATFRILSDTLFSGDLLSAEGEDADRFFDAVSEYIESFGKISPLDLLQAPQWIPRMAKLRTRKAVKIFNDRVDETIAKRKQRIDAGENVPTDLLTLILKAEDPKTGERMSEKEVKDNIITFVGAGHETTARAMAWLLYLVSQTPDVRNRMEQEVDAVLDAQTPTMEWLEKMPFVRAVIDETMRLYPPAPILLREAIEFDEAIGVPIPKDTLLVVSTYVLHRHNKLWDQPNAFMPERFLPENRDAIKRNSYLPFGVGPRICIGAQFALHEAVILTAMLLKHARFEFIGKQHPWPVQRITLRPEGKLLMRVTRR